MTKNTSKIRDGIRALGTRPNEILSGTVVPGSVDEEAYTISVQPSDDGKPINGVMLCSITGSGNGLLLFPKEASSVIIGSVDGPGEWTLIRSSEISKATITIGTVTYEMDSEQVIIRNGDTIFSLSPSLFKVNTAGESLFQLLKDCFTYITEITVSTPSGVSGVPINAVDFTNLITRLNNLLTS